MISTAEDQKMSSSVEYVSVKRLTRRKSNECVLKKTTP